MKEIEIDLKNWEIGFTKPIKITNPSNSKNSSVSNTDKILQIYKLIKNVTNLTDYKNVLTDDLVKVLTAMVYAESGGNPEAKNIYKNVKAYGLFQIVETTYKNLLSAHLSKIESQLKKLFGPYHSFAISLLQSKASNYLSVSLPEDIQVILGLVFHLEVQPKLTSLWSQNKLSVLFRNWKPGCSIQFANCIKKYYLPNANFQYNLSLISSPVCMQTYSDKICKTKHYEGLIHAQRVLKVLAILKGMKNENEVLAWLRNS